MLGLRKRRYERIAFELYHKLVIAARDPFFYASLGVPDTLDGRFDLVALYAFLLVRRLETEPSPGPELAQAVFDAMFSTMDVTLRELGVGDPSVPKRMRAMWEAFHGRAIAYDAALAAKDSASLEATLARNVWRGHPSMRGPALLARLVRIEVTHLAHQPLSELACGTVRFFAPSETSAKRDPDGSVHE